MLFKILLLAFIVLVPAALSAPTADDLVIAFSDGQVQGATYSTPNNVTYYGWRGIPFAAPPVGNLRFEAPQTPQPWTGILDATQDRNNCISIRHTENESEDCLFINVYSPKLRPTEKLSVLFWIFGGGFQMGGADKASYGPDHFMEENVILVSANYRLGPFGFLSTGDTVIRGNAGLKDQVLTMKWIKNNIASFGGDPDKVTIFGESVGGQSVGLHLISKQSEGLFRAAIVQSGSGMTNSTATINPQIYTFRLAGLIPGGNYGNDTRKLAEFLKNSTSTDIMNAVTMIEGRDQNAWPVVEVEGDEAFLSEYPYVAYENQNINPVPAIMGICAEEGLPYDLDGLNDTAIKYDRDPKQLIPSNLHPNASDEDIVAAKIRSFYLQEGTTFVNNLTGVVKFQSDNNFARALLKNAELYSKYAPAVYLYQFAYSTTPAIIDGIESAGHGAEINYLFYSPGPHTTPNIRDNTSTLVQKRIVNLWANFAKFLNPTPEQSDLLQNVIWPSVTPSNMQYLNMNASLEVRQDLKGDIYRQWNETYYNYGAKPFITF